MLTNNKKLAIFDFCETLINFQTADEFVNFILEKEKYNKYYWVSNIEYIFIRFKIIAVINKIFPKFNISKRFKLLKLRGITEIKITEYSKKYYNEYLVSNIIQPIFKKLKQHQDEGDLIVIISGGYLPYIKVFSENNNIQHYFATEMESKEGLLTGNFKGRDCMHSQKVQIIEKFIKENKIEYVESVCYSDSITDLPLLKWADIGYVISKNKTQNWPKTKNLNEIIIQ